MTKNELVQSVAEKAGLTRDQAARAVNATTSTIAECLAAGDTVRLQGVGTFDVVATRPRRAVHPRTRQVLRIPAGRRARFRIARSLRDILRVSR